MDSKKIKSNLIGVLNHARKRQLEFNDNQKVWHYINGAIEAYLSILKIHFKYKEK